jgi:hypothetical protein
MALPQSGPLARVPPHEDEPTWDGTFALIPGGQISCHGVREGTPHLFTEAAGAKRGADNTGAMAEAIM